MPAPRSSPLITYVTDPDIPPDRQLEIVRQVAALPETRIAFRLPGQPQGVISALVEAYLGECGPGEHGFLIHTHAELVDRYRDAGLWFSLKQPLPNVLLGAAASIHSLEDAATALDLGAGELIYGHVFATESHPGEQARGAQALERLMQRVSPDELGQAPVTAIGGIGPDTARAIGAVGCESLAMMRAISRAENIPEVLESTRAQWQLGSDDLNHEREELQHRDS